MNPASSAISKTIFLVLESNKDQDFLSELFQSQGFEVQIFSDYQHYIERVGDNQGCLVADLSMNSASGTALLSQLNRMEHLSPVVFVANMNSVSMVVEAIKMGAFDFIEKPFDAQTILEKTRHAMEDFQKNIEIINRYKLLTDKEKKVFACIVLGATNQQMTEKLHISTSTVEKHRASVMKKMQAETLPCLVKMLPMLDPLSIDLEPVWCNLQAS